ncbi:MAG: FtsX-like permease family protein [bacterium]|nr:FtsX-like permease family protein [bacterium]
MKINNVKQPGIGEWILTRITDPCEVNSIIGDFGEIYRETAEEKGLFNAKLWYWSHVVLSIPSFIKWLTIGSGAMFKNYTKMTIRNIRRNKGYSFINIFGLSIGIACFSLMLLWVLNELSYDGFHRNSDNIYRIIQKQNSNGVITHLSRTPPPIAKYLEENYPEVLTGVRIWNNSNTTFSYQNREYAERGIFADPELFTVFDFPILQGDVAPALEDPNSIFISERFAKKVFGNETALGKVLDAGNNRMMNVAGVFRNVPKNSHLQFDFVRPFEQIKRYGIRMNQWQNSNNPIYSYIHVSDNVNISALNSKIASIITDNVPSRDTEIYLQNLNDVYLRSDFTGDVSGLGNISFVYIFSIMAVFVLAIAVINFVNLTTAKSAKRAKEVGVRKVTGASRINLVRQFFVESIILSFISMVISCFIVISSMPVFNNLTGKTIDFNIQNILLYGSILLGITLVTGILSGIYPALFLSSFKPVTVLKGTLRSGIKGSMLRKSMVLVQFALSSILVLGSLIVFGQLNYLRNKDMGFERKDLIYLPMTSNLRTNFDTFKDQLLNDPAVLNASVCSHLLTDVTHIGGYIDWEGNMSENKAAMNCLLVDPDFVNTMSMNILEGRDFSSVLSTDTSKAFILNEEAVKQMGIDDVVGKRIKYGRSTGEIVGVVKNFHFKPLRNEIEPVILINSMGEPYYLYIRVEPGNITRAVDHINRIFSEFEPDEQLNYSFLDETLAAMYNTEERMGQALIYFTAIAVLISCLGLFGLVSYIAEQLKKEIGIRKVLGASVSGLVVFLSLDFIKWVIIANVISWPVAYWALNSWLNNFAYRLQIGWLFFLYSSLIAVIIALITLSYQTIKAATASPVDSLQYE